MDITSDSDVKRAIGEIMSHENRIDVVINNAGITLSGPTLQFSVDDFKKILDINVIGSFRIAKEIFSLSLKSRRVKI